MSSCDEGLCNFNQWFLMKCEKWPITDIEVNCYTSLDVYVTINLVVFIENYNLWDAFCPGRQMNDLNERSAVKHLI